MPMLIESLVENPNPSGIGLPGSFSSLTLNGPEFQGPQINPTGLTGTLNDWAPTGLATARYVLMTAAGATTINGIAGGTDGRLLTLITDTTSAAAFTIGHESVGSQAANRITCPQAAAQALPAATLGVVVLRYSGVAQRWQVIDWYSNSTAGAYSFTGGLSLTSNTSPAALASGNNNDWTPSAALRIRATPAAGGSTVTGMSTGVSNGNWKVIHNISTTDSLTITHNDALSVAANRFFLPNNASIVIRPNGSATFLYDGTSSAWRLMGAAL